MSPTSVKSAFGNAPAALVLLVGLAASGIIACGDGDGDGAAPTPSATPGPPDVAALYAGSVRYREPGVVIIDEVAYTVTLSDSGQLAGFKPGQEWHLADPDGAQILSGTILGEFGQWERGVDFVRLDDERVIAFSVDIDGNWSVHLAEDECRWNIYWAARYPLLSPQPSGAADIATGFHRVAAFCEEELGLAAE